jgi:site-specific recombinase XerD
MDNLSLRFVYDRRNEIAKGKSAAPLHIEVRQNKTINRIFINTYIKLKPSEYSDKNGFTCKNHPNATAITAKAHRIFREVEEFVLSDNCRTLEDVKNWDKDESLTHSIVSFIYCELKRRDPSLTVIKQNKAFIRRLEDYGKIKVFADLTYQNLLGFDEYLRQFIKSSPTLYKRHSLFKGYINEAVKRGLCKHNPYDLFSIPKGKSKDPIFLTTDEVIQIELFETDNNRLDKVRELFIFQCYTGMAYVDTQNFKQEDIIEMDGYKVIRSNRKKTDESFISLLLPEAERVLMKFEYCLPKISNQKYNDYLKLVGLHAGIKKKITSHVARHTFATYLLNKNIPLETVSRALGHTNLKQTQHYAKLLGKKVIEDMKKLIN